MNYVNFRFMLFDFSLLNSMSFCFSSFYLILPAEFISNFQLTWFNMIKHSSTNIANSNITLWNRSPPTPFFICFKYSIHSIFPLRTYTLFIVLHICLCITNNNTFKFFSFINVITNLFNHSYYRISNFIWIMFGCVTSYYFSFVIN